MGHGATGILRRFTGHRDDLGELFRAEVPRRTGSRRIVQQSDHPSQQDLVDIAVRFGCIECFGSFLPALAPIPHTIATQMQPPGDRVIAETIGRG
jgi:hypothetical protein